MLLPPGFIFGYKNHLLPKGELDRWVRGGGGGGEGAGGGGGWGLTGYRCLELVLCLKTISFALIYFDVSKYINTCNEGFLSNVLEIK